MKLEHGVVDCAGYRVTDRRAWSSWGLLVCQAPGGGDGVYGTIGPVDEDVIPESRFAVALDPQTDPLATLALTCGLTILDRAGAELGDRVVVAGASVLGRAVLQAARLQGATTVCVAASPDDLQAAAGWADQIVDYNDVEGFDAAFDAALKDTPGKRVFVDTSGRPEIAYTMMARLNRFEPVVFTRQEATSLVRINIADFHHRKSAQFIYWARPTTLAEGLRWDVCAQRAARLLAHERAAPLTAAA